MLVKIRSAAWQNAMGGPDAAALAAQVASLRNRMEAFCKRCACRLQPGLQTCDSEIDTLKQSVDGEAELWAAPLQGLAGQFKSVVEELAKLPTGRTLILVSDGFNLDPRREFYPVVARYLADHPQFRLNDSGEVAPALKDALKVAAERNVAIYTVDSRGGAAVPVAGGAMVDATAAGGANPGGSMIGTNRPSGRNGPMQSTANDTATPMRVETSVSMEQMARASGGVYYQGTSDLLKDLRSALADGREYYVLAYAPKNSAPDGKFRTITVETTDKKLTIRAKPGYWAEGAAQ
jgi:VWFA-related protein